MDPVTFLQLRTEFWRETWMNFIVLMSRCIKYFCLCVTQRRKGKLVEIIKENWDKCQYFYEFLLGYTNNQICISRRKRSRSEKVQGLKFTYVAYPCVALSTKLLSTFPSTHILCSSHTHISTPKKKREDMTCRLEKQISIFIWEE